MQLETIKVDWHDKICCIQFYRRESQNKINSLMTREIQQVLDCYGNESNVILLEGLDEYFCMGADFNDSDQEYKPDLLFQLWYQLATGPYITISHVKGQVAAGGMGFIAASDIVIADSKATFCLSELLFGLYPAMVLPFLIRKAGFQTANYMTLMTKPILAERAVAMGIVDVCGDRSRQILGQHLMRLNKVPKTGITAYKQYMEQLNPILKDSYKLAVESNFSMFQNEENQRRIKKFSELGLYPWEE